jgi:hypothetical protein
MFDLKLLSSFLDKDSVKTDIQDLRVNPFLDPGATAKSDSPKRISLADASSPFSGSRRNLLFRLAFILVAGLCLLGLAVLCIGLIAQINPKAVARHSDESGPVQIVADAIFKILQGTRSQSGAQESLQNANEHSADSVSPQTDANGKTPGPVLPSNAPKNSKGTVEQGTKDQPPSSPDQQLSNGKTGKNERPAQNQESNDTAQSTVRLLVWLSVLFALLLFLEFWLFERATHLPDPLFSRLLQHRFGASRPYSARFVARLLGNPCFGLVLKRATNRILPGIPPQPSSATAWESLKGRLEDELKEDEKFLQLFSDRIDQTNRGPEIVDSDGAISAYLIETIRLSLFAAILADPDLEHLYNNMVKWSGLLGWAKEKIDLQMLKDIVGNRSQKKPESARIEQGLAYATLVVLALLVLEFVGARASTKSGDEGNRLSVIADETARIRVALEEYFKHGDDHQPIEMQCPQPGTINIAPSPSPANVSVAPPTINFPSKISIDDPAQQPASPSSLNISVNPRSDPPFNSPCCDKNGGGANQKPDDTLLKLTRKNGTSFVETIEGDSCSFSATLLWQDPRSPHPVSATIAPDLPKNKGKFSCPSTAFTIYASQKTVYNPTLKASIKVEEMHRWLGVGTEFVYLRIHPEPASMDSNSQTANTPDPALARFF